MTAEQMNALMQKQEALHPELAKFVTMGKPFPMLRHPLVYCMLYAAQMNAMLNAQYEQKRRALSAAQANRDWSQFVFLHERPHRLNAFLVCKKYLSDTEYWSLLGTIWTDSENIWQNQRAWQNLLSAKRHGQEHMMEAADRKFWRSLPARMYVWRGGSSAHPRQAKGGLSWTLDTAKSHWFANRLLRPGEKPLVYGREVRKHEAIAYFSVRNESEVIVLPSRKSPAVLVSA